MYTTERRRWSVIPLLIAALLALGTTTAALAATTTSPALVPTCDTQRMGPPQRDPSPGQLTRRGIIGYVIQTVDEGGTLVTIVVGTQFGSVDISVPEGFDTEINVGDRVAVLTVKEPTPPESTPPVVGTPPEDPQTGTPIIFEPPEEGQTDTTFRITVAKKMTIIPSTSSRSHSRAVVQSQGDGTIEVIDDQGNVNQFGTTDEGGVQVPPTEGDGTSGDGTGGDTSGQTTGDGTTGLEGEGDEPPAVEQEIVTSGTDAILLTQCSGPGADPIIRSILQASRIAARLVRLQTRFADDPDKLAKFEELQDAQSERLQARLDRTASNAPPGSQASVGKAQRQASGECEEDPDPELCPDNTRKGQGRSQGGDGGDGGDGGNQGGGNKGKGPPEDQGKP